MVRSKPNVGKRALPPTDPRWVLAVRTWQMLQGATLQPLARAKLLSVGRLMGLTPFEANLVIAITQDQARQGRGPDGAATILGMVPMRRNERRGEASKVRRVIYWTMLALVVEIVVVASLI